ncbi:MAG: hypothetical protein MI742_15535 [Desulfobacterales bacterium]|nr:hypothetical protein [Desulfobacterales bacterium]
MDLKGNIASSIYKRALTHDLGEVSLDSRMLTLLMQMDGEKNAATLAGELGMTLSEIRDVILRLSQLGLIEEVLSTVPSLSEEFYRFLSNRLSMAMGPMAEILLEDLLVEMKINRQSIPLTQAADLVGELAREIPREEKRVEFQQALLERLRSYA